MRVITTAILGLVAILLGVVIWAVDHQPALEDQSAVNANVLVRFDQDYVDKITIEKGPVRTVMVKRGGFWFFSEPEEDRVNSGAIAVILDQLNHLSLVDTIESSDVDLRPEAIGIKGDNALKLTLSGTAGEDSKERVEHSIVLGVEAPRAQSIYAQRGADGAIFVVDGNPRKWLESPLEALRDSRLVSAPVEGIVQLVVRWSTGEMALQRRITNPPQAWAIAKPLQTWASPDVMDKLLADLAKLRVEEVVGESADVKIPNPLPEDSVVLQIQVLGVEKPLTVFLKQVEAPPVEGAPALLEATVSDRPVVFRLQSTVLDQIPKTTDDVRDRTLARIPMAYLDSITIQSRIDPYVYLKSQRMDEGLRWDVKINNKLMPANLAQVASLVSGVNEAAIQGFASDSAEDLTEFGLNPPARRVTFDLRFPGPPNQDGSPGQEQALQRVLNLGWKEGNEQRLFANFEGEGFVYELDPTFVSLIPTHPIKWRSRSVLTFSPFHLRSITREQTGRENLKLDYDYRRDQWKAFRNGGEVSTSLDIAAARRLRDRLGALTSAGWYLSLASAYEALQTPSVKFVIVTNELDPAVGEPRPKTYEVKLAPSSTNVYFGQIEGSPDVFILDHETYRDLIRPVTSSRITNP